MMKPNAIQYPLVVLMAAMLLLWTSPVLAQAPDGQPYVVQADDWLSKIAEKTYGNPRAYLAIVQATNAKAAQDDSFTPISDPNIIRVGQKLWLPNVAGESTPAPPAGATNRLTLDQLKNGTYSGIYDAPVTLSNGAYAGEPFVEGGAARPTVTFVDDSVAYGDLTGDGVEDAAVLLAENSGGSGVFTYLAAVINQNGQPVDGGSVMLGDRTQVKTMVIENGQVTVEIITQGPDEPMCCGTLKVRKTLALQDGKLAEVGSEELGHVSLEDLMGSSWTLERLKADQPALTGTLVTAAFADGQISGTAGCNNYTALVSSNNGQALSVGVATATQKACPDPIMTQETQYLSALQKAMQWSYLGGKLAILYQQDDGAVEAMTLSPVAPPQAATPAAPTTGAPPTEVITYKPTAIPSETRSGSCFASAIGLGRTDAYRCTVGNEIFDPCFVVNDTPTVICGANPTTGDIGFVLALTKPLPTPDAGQLARPWLVELADGTVCGLLTGTVPGVGDRIASYGCPDRTYLFDDFQQGPVWMAEKASIGVNDNGYFVEKSEMVPIRRVWK